MNGEARSGRPSLVNDGLMRKVNEIVHDDRRFTISDLSLHLPQISRTLLYESYVYWTVHHLDSRVKTDQLDVTSFIISLFNAQHVSDVNTSILRSSATYLLSYFMGCIALVRCVLVLRCGLAVVVWYPYAG